MSGLSQKSKWTTSFPAQHWSFLERSGHLFLQMAFYSSVLMAQFSASKTIWPSGCLATAKTSCWERLANMTSLAELLRLKTMPAFISVTAALSSTECHFPYAWFLWMDGWVGKKGWLPLWISWSSRKKFSLIQNIRKIRWAFVCYITRVFIYVYISSVVTLFSHLFFLYAFIVLCCMSVLFISHFCS